MAATGMNMLQAIATQVVAAQGAPAVQAEGGAAATITAGNSFATLVKQAGDALASPEATAAARNSARPTATAEATALLKSLLGYEITPEDAEDILAHLADEEASTQTEADAEGGDERLKQQLQAIITSQTPRTTADVLAAVTNEAEVTPAELAKLLGTLPVAQATATGGTTTTTPEAATLGTAAQQMLHFITKTLAKAATVSATKPSEELSQGKAEVSVATLNTALLALSAAPFSAGEGDAQPQEEQAKAIAAPESATLVIAPTIPLAQQVTIAAPAEAEADTSIIESNALPATAPIDARIPALALPNETTDEDGLPQVTLPGAAIPDSKALASETMAATGKGTDEFKTLATQATAHTAQTIKGEKHPAELNALTGIVAQDPANAATAIAPTMGLTQSSVSDIAPSAAVIGDTHIVNHAPVAEQVSVAIHQAGKDGLEKITVQLDPVELGRIEVNLHMGKDGHTRLTFLVDKASTFDALSRDAHHLERTLQEAGIKADTGGMQFNLRQQPQPFPSNMQGDGQSSGGQQGDTPAPAESAPDKTSMAAPPPQQYRVNVHEGLDIRA